MKPLKEKQAAGAKKPVAVPLEPKPVAVPVVARAQDQELRQRMQQPPPIPAVPRSRPELPADVRQFFLPIVRPASPGEEVVYRPRVLAMAEVAFVDRRKGLEHRKAYRLLANPPAPGQSLQWLTAEPFEGQPLDAPQPVAGWAPVPESVNSAKKLKALEKAFAEYLYGSARLRLFENKKLGLLSQPQEDLLAFGQRCREAALLEAGKAYEAERVRYLPKFNALNLPMPSLSVEQRSGTDTGGGVLGWVLAPLKLGASAVKAVAGTAPTKKQLDLEADWKGRVAALYEKWRQIGEGHTELLLTPRKVDVQVSTFGLAWAPIVRGRAG
jgi:hypothetical protein